jgi:hypothetical protein
MEIFEKTARKLRSATLNIRRIRKAGVFDKLLASNKDLLLHSDI